jgi:hypothetical protein
MMDSARELKRLKLPAESNLERPQALNSACKITLFKGDSKPYKELFISSGGGF